MTYREIVYMVLDEIKSASDDAFFTEEHVIFLAGKIRAFLLKQKYSDIKKQVPESNYQNICLNLIQVPAISGEPCEGGIYLRSRKKIPSLMLIGTPRVYPLDYYQGEITYVSKDRMRYIGHNKFLQNIIYCSIGPDNYLYFKSNNPQFLYLEKVKMIGVFEDSMQASDLQCSDDDEIICDPIDRIFPLEEGLIANAIELIIKYLLDAVYRGKDNNNNANDDLSDIAGFLRKNMKSGFREQLDGE